MAPRPAPPAAPAAPPPADDATPAPAAPAGPPPHVLPDDLLARAPDEAVRLVALALLAQAVAARERLADPQDAEALHAFRVALRRLRSTVRAHRRLLRDSVPRKVRDRLRDVAQASGASRDLEVQLEWLDAQRSSLYSRHRAGGAWLRARLLRAKARADDKLARVVGPAFDKVRATLARDLPVYWRKMHVHAPAVRARFAPVLAARLRDVSAELGASLVAVTGPEAVHEAHEARIAAKRVRYLLEPVKAHVEGAGAAISRLRKLQDALGELHDLDIMAEVLAKAMDKATAEQEALAAAALAAADGGTAAPLHGRRADDLPPDAAAAGEGAAATAGEAGASGATAAGAAPPTRAAGLRDPRPGLAALAKRARTRREALFAEITESWLAGGAAALVASLDALAAALDATTDPHAPPLEIERKFLLRSLPHVLREAPYAEIEQGWLPGERLLERLRRVRRDGTERLYRTVKLGAGVTRVEIEEATSPDLFALLWPATAARRIRKRRYAVEEGGLTWEVDLFLGRELVMAEIELPSPDTPVQPPPWLAPYVLREVTDDPAYVNANLAVPEDGAAG